jgi:hypothetical protein
MKSFSSSFFALALALAVSAPADAFLPTPTVNTKLQTSLSSSSLLSSSLSKPSGPRSLSVMMKATKKNSKQEKKHESPKIKHYENDEIEEIIVQHPEHPANTLKLNIETSVVMKGRKYVIGVPADSPIAVTDDEEFGIELDDPIMEEILPIVEGKFQELGHEVQRTPAVLTLKGDVKLYDEDSLEENGNEGEEKEEGEKDLPGEDDMDDLDGELIIDTVPIFDFEHKGTKYTVVQYIDILPLVAQEGAMGSWKLMNAEEGDKVFDVVYEHDLEDMMTEAQNEELQNA